MLRVIGHVVCLTLICIAWWKRNARIIKNKGKTSEIIWVMFCFYSSFWASTTTSEAYKKKTTTTIEGTSFNVFIT